MGTGNGSDAVPQFPHSRGDTPAGARAAVRARGSQGAPAERRRPRTAAPGLRTHLGGPGDAAEPRPQRGSSCAVTGRAKGPAGAELRPQRPARNL